MKEKNEKQFISSQQVEVSLKTLFNATELDFPDGVVAKKSGGNLRGEKSKDLVFKVQLAPNICVFIFIFWQIFINILFIIFINICVQAFNSHWNNESSRNQNMLYILECRWALGSNLCQRNRVIRSTLDLRVCQLGQGGKTFSAEQVWNTKGLLCLGWTELIFVVNIPSFWLYRFPFAIRYIRS